MSKYTFYWSSVGKGYVTKSVLDDVKFNKVQKGDALADYGFIQSQFRSMLGKVLTVIDAAIIDPKQNKAIKDIIRNEFIDEYVHLSELMAPIDQDAVDEMTENMSEEEFSRIEEASIEDVAGA